jgi:cytochrome c oxidase subunit 2
MMESKMAALKFNRGCAAALGSIAWVLAAAGCTKPPGARYPLDTLTPHSDVTQTFYNIFYEITAIDIVILIIVTVAFFLALFVFSSRMGEPGEQSRKHHDLYLEMAWTIIPSIIVVFITVPTVRAIIQTQPDKWPPDALEVRVIAHQWWWEFRYPSTGVVTADEAHIPAHRTIHFAMVSRDVIHSFFMPAIGGKRDVVPGQTNSITLNANDVGEYWGQCTEFCGDSHANMRFRVFVDSPEDFDAWTKHQLEDPVKPTEGPAAAGAKIFADAPCAICHTIKGVSGFSKEYTFGFRGPDLTHFGSRGTLAGAMLDNTPENLNRWIENPVEVKPGANMPTLGLTGEERSELVAYLESLK